MNTKEIIEIQKKQLMIHRIVYAVFIISRLIFQLENSEIVLRSNKLIVGFILVTGIFEELLAFKDYFNNLILIRALRYIQCVFMGMMFVFLHGVPNPKTMIVSLLIMYLIELLLTLEVEKSKVILCFSCVSIPIMCYAVIDINCFLDMLVFFVLLGAAVYVFIDYSSLIEKKFFDKQNELDLVIEQKENISNMQTILKNSNTQLNLQKIELQKANEQINIANEEMHAQTEIMRYIARAVEIPKISTHIVDTIIRTKQLGFCAVYMKEGVFDNGQPHYAIRTDIAQLQSKLKDSMESICMYLVSTGEKEGTYYDNLREKFPFLKDLYINSVYVKVLELNGEAYGLFMMGDNKRRLFDENMSFYDSILAQFDIAVHNAKIYNQMEFMARKDGLTKVNNRVYFTQLFNEVANEIKWSNGNLSVAILDIDKFKNVNDTYGHLAGDEVIKRIASVTEKCIEKYDGFICRYGGEEFVAVLPNRKLEVAHSIIEELFEELCSQIVYYEDYEIPMSVSIGLTSYPEVCKDTGDLLRRADDAMYYAKEHGRHQIYTDKGDE